MDFLDPGDPVFGVVSDGEAKAYPQKILAQHEIVNDDLAWRQPTACGIGQSSSGLLASIPAILSGTACCGPVVLIVVGIQASGVLLTAFQFLLPVAVLLLLGSLVLVGRQVDPQPTTAQSG